MLYESHKKDFNTRSIVKDNEAFRNDKGKTLSGHKNHK